MDSHHRRGVGLVGDVGAQRRGVASRVADGLGDVLGPPGLLAVVDDDVGVRVGELPRDLRADAPGGARHQDDLWFVHVGSFHQAVTSRTRLTVHPI